MATQDVFSCLTQMQPCRCHHCQERGATIGCRVDRCPLSFHLHCAKAAGCTFYPASYAVACPTHAPAFRHEADQDRCDPSCMLLSWASQSRMQLWCPLGTCWMPSMQPHGLHMSCHAPCNTDPICYDVL